jgi:hypothetical protein
MPPFGMARLVSNQRPLACEASDLYLGASTGELSGTACCESWPRARPGQRRYRLGLGSVLSRTAREQPSLLQATITTR